jgi:hypothetical protein
MKKTVLLIAFWLGLGYAYAQNVDSIFSEHIHSVEFRANGNFRENLPIIDLKKESFLVLTFDDLGELRNLNYTIEQCDRDWKPTKLDKLEYIEGLPEDRLNNYKNAQATNIHFVHYRLTIPNENVRWNKSGNYVLKIFEDNYEKTPVLTRRFMVYEPIVAILPEFTVSNATKFNTHHEVDFKIDPKNFRIQNPMNEIRTTILQNARWDNARISVPPTFVMADKLVYDYQDSLTFWAGKEWRYADLRSSRFRTERVFRIDQGEETWDVTLRTDLDRLREPYLIYPDLNGSFFSETKDFPNQNIDQLISADYMDTYFSLNYEQEIEDADVYIFGKLSDFKIDERFKMTYNEQRHLYEGMARLKQGFYNYIYAVVPKDKNKKPDFSKLEGDWYGAENEYHILAYYRPVGARYDRIIGYVKAQWSMRR